jgi:hypothetical protein
LSGEESVVAEVRPALYGLSLEPVSRKVYLRLTDEAGETTDCEVDCAGDHVVPVKSDNL